LEVDLYRVCPACQYQRLDVVFEERPFFLVRHTRSFFFIFRSPTEFLGRTFYPTGLVRFEAFYRADSHIIEAGLKVPLQRDDSAFSRDSPPRAPPLESRSHPTPRLIRIFMVSEGSSLPVFLPELFDPLFERFFF